MAAAASDKLRLRVEVSPSAVGSAPVRYLLPIDRTKKISDLCALLSSRLSLNASDVTLTLQDGTLIFPDDQLVDVVGDKAEDVIFAKVARKKVGMSAPPANVDDSRGTTPKPPIGASTSFDSGYGSSSNDTTPSSHTIHSIPLPSFDAHYAPSLDSQFAPSLDSPSAPSLDPQSAPSFDAKPAAVIPTDLNTGGDAWGSGAESVSSGADNWGAIADNVNVPPISEATGSVYGGPRSDKYGDARISSGGSAYGSSGGGNNSGNAGGGNSTGGAWQSMHNPAHQGGAGDAAARALGGGGDKGPRGAFKVFIGAMSYNTTDESLNECFSKYGTINDSVVMVERDTGRPRGFGFVTYSHQSEADAAIAGMDGQYLDGRAIRVNMANSVPRSGGGGYGSGNGYGGGSGGGGYGGGGGGYSGSGDSGGYGGNGGRGEGGDDAGDGGTGSYW